MKHEGTTTIRKVGAEIYIPKLTKADHLRAKFLSEK